MTPPPLDLSSCTSAQKDALIGELFEQIRRLQAQVAELQARVEGNSRNSSRPPASDGYDKPAPKSRRGRSGKRPGGQRGHKGSTLSRVGDPDHVVEHRPGRCGGCGHELSEAPAASVEGWFSIRRTSPAARHSIAHPCFPAAQVLAGLGAGRCFTHRCPTCACGTTPVVACSIVFREVARPRVGAGGLGPALRWYAEARCRALVRVSLRGPVDPPRGALGCRLRRAARRLCSPFALVGLRDRSDRPRDDDRPVHWLVSR